MSGNSSLNPQVGASASDVWQQFFREALRKRGDRAAAAANTEEIVPAGGEMRASSIADASAATATASASAESPASVTSDLLDEGAPGDESLRTRLALTPLEVLSLGLFGAAVFCFVSLLLYNPGDYFNSEILRTRAEVSFGVGKTIFRPFGLAVYSLLGFTLFWSGAVFFRQGVRGVALKAFGAMVFTTALAGLLGLAFPGEDGAGTLVHGGILGEFLARRMTGSFDTLGATALLVLVGLISLIFATDWFFTSLARDGGAAVAERDEAETDADDDETGYGARDESIPLPGAVDVATRDDENADADARHDDEAGEAEAPGARGEGGAPPPAVLPAVPASRHPEPVPLEPAALEPAPATDRREAPSSDEAEATRILSRAVRASSPAAPRRRTPPPPEFDPIEAEAARPAETLSDENSDLEPPRRTATARPRLRWRRRDDVTATEPEFGAGLLDDAPSAAPLPSVEAEQTVEAEQSSAPAAPMAAPLPVAETISEPEPEPEAEPKPTFESESRDSARQIGTEDPEAEEVEDVEDEVAEDEEVAVLAEPEPEPEMEPEPEVWEAPAESPSSASARKAQLSLFDEVIDEISKAGRESRTSAPRRPSSPIPPVPAPSVPASIDAATYDDAVRIVLEAGRGSVSLLQRRLDVGYVTANRLLELMERDGVVGEHRGSGPREVRTTIDEWMRRKPSGRTQN